MPLTQSGAEQLERDSATVADLAAQWQAAPVGQVIVPAKLTAVSTPSGTDPRQYAWTEQWWNADTYGTRKDRTGGESGTITKDSAYFPNNDGPTSIPTAGLPVFIRRCLRISNTAGWRWEVIAVRTTPPALLGTAPIDVFGPNYLGGSFSPGAPPGVLGLQGEIVGPIDGTGTPTRLHLTDIGLYDFFGAWQVSFASFPAQSVCRLDMYFIPQTTDAYAYPTGVSPGSQFTLATGYVPPTFITGSPVLLAPFRQIIEVNSIPSPPGYVEVRIYCAYAGAAGSTATVASGNLYCVMLRRGGPS